MKSIKAVVIVMGLLILAGLGLLVPGDHPLVLARPGLVAVGELLRHANPRADLVNVGFQRHGV